jgi:gluconolactonase
VFGPVRSRSAEDFAQVPASGLLEGPAFDRDGNLFVVDMTGGRIHRISPDAEVSLVTEYEGEPNGLKIHSDGRLFVADRKRGLLVVDAETGNITIVCDRPFGERFRGPNDLVFSRTGDLYFTDQGESDLRDPSGRLYRLAADGSLACLLDNVPSPNGLVFSPDESLIYLAVTRANAIWRIPVGWSGEQAPGRDGIGRVGTWVQMSGGLGPDGLAMDVAGRLSVAHPGMGCVWVFEATGEPFVRIRVPSGLRVTNLAFGGRENRSLYITEADTGSIFRTDMDIPGVRMFSHLQ